ncbi:MAG: hypothetical protein OXF74_03890 [Rhodobacteraceae bacterium]|nr:hypothetical protein [Paracoccaceae bacterium]
MSKIDRITIRIEPELQVEIKNCLAAELAEGREMSTAAFIRMAVRRLIREQKQQHARSRNHDQAHNDRSVSGNAATASAAGISARQREEMIMQLLARIAYGEGDSVIREMRVPLRQLGYAASLVQGYLDDPHDMLNAVILQAEKAPEEKSPLAGYRDPVQAKPR